MCSCSCMEMLKTDKVREDRKEMLKMDKVRIERMCH